MQTWALMPLINSSIYSHLAIDSTRSRIFIMQTDTSIIHYYSLSNGTATRIGNLTFQENVQSFLIYGQFLVIYRKYFIYRISLSDFSNIVVLGDTGSNLLFIISNIQQRLHLAMLLFKL